MQLALGFLLLAFAQAVTVVGPGYPPNAVAGGTVVALLHVSSGSVSGIEVLQADSPFGDAAKAALSGWRFKDSDDGNILVVFSFRAPTLYSTGDPTRHLPAAKPVTGLAYPKTVVEPAYPPTSQAEGSTVLRLDVNAAGSVSRVRIVKDLGDATGACVTAARSWRFVPALDNKGISVPSEAYAVCVVRRPIVKSPLP
jgi:hypothetical protein